MSYLSVIKNLGLILIILGHYYFCSYVLSEVHNMKNYEPALYKQIENEDNKKITTDVTKVNKAVTKDESIGMVEISKIALRRKLYKMGSKENNVSKNIEILESSSMPDENGGNFILAAHNGNSSVGHFKNLHKLEIGDEVILTYNGKKYIYKIADKYDVLKTGKVAIRRDRTKNTITLITCLGLDRQLVVIGYLKQ